MLRRRFSAGFVGAVIAFASCREPTQITITVTTNAECPGEAGVEPTLIDTFITAGSQLRAEDLVAANVTRKCTPKPEDNTIGTLVLIPGDGDDKTVDVVVIGGVDSHAMQAAQGTATVLNADDCRALVESRQGVLGQPCIVAKRRLGFIDHTRLALPIMLDKRCIGVECAEDKTCFGGVCVDPTVTCDEAGNCSDPSGEGGGVAGCDPTACTADCEINAQVGTCLDEVCDCGGCSPTGCDNFCSADGDVGSCDGDDCDCQTACDQPTCATMTCDPPTIGNCNATTNLCECACDPGLCDVACGGAGNGSCASGGCVCDQTCNLPSECTGVTCDAPFDVDCIGGNCGCACNNAECDSGCPGGGMCMGIQTCQCWPCEHQDCDDDCAPGLGTCTPNGCDCACVVGNCNCGEVWEDPFCNAQDVCDCQCNQTECTNFCAPSQVGTCVGDVCQCSGGVSSATSTSIVSSSSVTSSSVSSTSIASSSSVTSSSVTSSSVASSSSGMTCDVGMCNALCAPPPGMFCDPADCDCDCNATQCNFECAFGGMCMGGQEGMCICNSDPTSGAGAGGMGAGPGAAGGQQSFGGFGASP